MSDITKDELAFSVWKNKYAAPGETHPDEMHFRMANEFEKIEKQYIKKEKSFWNIFKRRKLSDYGKKRKNLSFSSIYNLFKDFKYVIPQGSIMATLGTDQIASLSNCWLIESPEDSYTGIHKADGDLIYYYKRRGGVGMDISKLRPEGVATKNAAKSSTGAVSFMERFSNTTREVAMNGRRGALMISIDVNHPDSLSFARSKSDKTKITGANISLKLNRAFMLAVTGDKDYYLRYPCDTDLAEFGVSWYDSEYNCLRYMENKDNKPLYVKKIRAKEYWDEFIRLARDNAEPGLMYWDNVLDGDPAAVYEQYKPEGSNPCGEQFLQPNDSCRLIVHNLFSYIENPFTADACFNFNLFYENCYETMRLGDDIIDLELEYIQRIIDKIKSDPESDNVKRQELDLWEKSKRICEEGRRVGIGITALGDTFAALSLSYGEDDSLDLTHDIMKLKMKAELDCSVDLSILRGSFKGWDIKKEYIDCSNIDKWRGVNHFYDFIRSVFKPQVERMMKYGRRNVSWSTIAPTGSVSLLANNCTSGCEPLFMPFYMRRKKINPNEKGSKVDFIDENKDSWQEYHVLHPNFKAWIDSNYPFNQNMSSTDDLSREQLQGLFEKSPWYGSTANDIDWQKRIGLQSILQRYTTNAISSTINLPSTVTYKEVSNIYLQGWYQNLKGQTIYVDGSRTGVLVSEKAKEDSFSYKDAPKRPDDLPVEIYSTISKGTKWNVLVGLYENKPYEVFAVPQFTNESNLNLVKKKKGKYDLYKNGELYKEDISSKMNSEQEAITRLVSTSLRHGADITFIVEQLNKSHGDITSFNKAISRILSKYANQEKLKEKFICDECNSLNIVFEEGCFKCLDCGYSKCS